MPKFQNQRVDKTLSCLKIPEKKTRTEQMYLTQNFALGKQAGFSAQRKGEMSAKLSSSHDQ